MDQTSKAGSAARNTIADSPRVLLFLAVAVALLGFGVYIPFDSSQAHHPLQERLLMGGFSIACSVPVFILFLANMKGYVVDMENDTFEYPGGGIAADSFIDYFRPGFWLQWFKRYTITLSDIRHVETFDKIKLNWSDTSKKYNKKKRYHLDIDGDFGAVSFCFMSKGKRDQLYSALVVANRMGSPVNVN